MCRNDSPDFGRDRPKYLPPRGLTDPPLAHGGTTRSVKLEKTVSIEDKLIWSRVVVDEMQVHPPLNTGAAKRLRAFP